MKPRTSNNDSHSYICLNGVKPIKPDVANLFVTTHGSVSWNDERMGDEQLAQRLQASAPRQPQPEDFSSAATAWWVRQRVAQVLASTQKSGC